MTATGQPTMIDLDQSQPIDLESLKAQYPDKFASYTPKPSPQSQSHPSIGKHKLTITPPVLNSSSPWATTVDDLRTLYNSPYTGAVTTRTSLLEGFAHNPDTHQHTFFTSGSSSTGPASLEPLSQVSRPDTEPLKPRPLETTGISSLNTYGYSPHTLSEYLGYINEIVGQRHLGTSTVYKKPFIISVTGSPEELAMSYALIASAAEMDEDLDLSMEVNLSCPNIGGKPPPGYDGAMFGEVLRAIGKCL